ncbi:MAG: hypothetical protein H6739_35455 [Alphaproteobacteria bacterium]|nr:hypothetical protein [Alphaproteobacteria bacterium]
MSPSDVANQLLYDELLTFLQTAFDVDEFRKLLKSWYGRGFVSKLPGPVASVEEFFGSAVDNLRYHNHIDGELFDRLLNERPKHPDAIQGLRRLWDGDGGGGGGDDDERNPSRSRRRQLAYRATNGVIETHFYKKRDEFMDFIGRALVLSDYAREEHKNIRMLSTFMADTVETELLRKIFSRGRPATDQGLQICLANPHSKFAEARAKAMGKAALAKKSGNNPPKSKFKSPVDESKEGLIKIIEALCPTLSWDEIAEYSKYDHNKLTDKAREKGAGHNIEIRFYDTILAGPLWFFGDLLVMGRISAINSALNLPWSLIVNDVDYSGDLYDMLSKEFDQVWAGASQEQVP